MAKKKKSKIIRYRHPLNINVGMIIFAIIFVYLVFSVYTYMKKEKVQFYESVEGNIVNDRQYTGIILRDERVESTDRAGYINYYIREGKRAAIGTRIYSIDETGNMAELMQENPDAFVTADEIGCGIVPMEAFERDYRETDGRICQRIAAYSEEVHRVICGLGMRIK